jgi:hypothetical protein
MRPESIPAFTRTMPTCTGWRLAAVRIISADC